MRSLTRVPVLALALALAWGGLATAPAATGFPPEPRSGSPTGGFTTSDGAVLVGAPSGSPETSLSAVTGWARAVAGVRRVRVSFCPGSAEGGGYQCGSTPALGEWRSVRAALACSRATTRCDWRATTPLTPGRYVVVARVVDDRGRSRTVGAVAVTVV